MGTRERRARSDESDRLLISLYQSALKSGDFKTGVEEIAIAAVGGYGRGELFPGSDLDIVFLHKDSLSEDALAAFVNSVLYPLWDKGVSIDHSVRTRSQTRDAARNDIRVATGLLDIRYIVGDHDIVDNVHREAQEDWHFYFKNHFELLKTSLLERHQRSGDLAYLLEPDLKEAKGGLRDAAALRAIAAADVLEIPLDRISSAEAILSTVREELHIVTQRGKDKLFFQEQDKVSARLKYADADELMANVAHSARSIAYLLDFTLHRIEKTILAKKSFLGRKDSRQEIGKNVFLKSDEVVMHFESGDSDVGLRASALAAQRGVPLSLYSCVELAQNIKSADFEIPTPWPRSTRENLITLIGAGAAMIPVWEALDQEEIIFSWIPEWRAVRSLPQRNALHRHTVDRHMVETAVHAAQLTRRVHRPDLLLFAALFHDIGKGTDADHCKRGEQLIIPLAKRLGFSESDVNTIALLVRHHLLLAATATRRDLDDPATIASVLAVIPNLETLELLHALSIADGEATGKAAWSDWKAGLVAELVNRVKSAMTGTLIAQQPEVSAVQLEIARRGELWIEISNRGSEYEIEIIAPDKPGLLSVVAGVLNVARLDVRSARTKTIEASAVMRWIVVSSPHAQEPTREKLQRDLADALIDARKIEKKISDRIDSYSQQSLIPVPPLEIEVFDDAATDATVIEIRSHDRPALLFTIGSAVTRCQIDIKSAIVTTLGAEAIDTLYVTEISGEPLSPLRALQVKERLASLLK